MTMIERVAKAIYEASPFKMTEGPYERQSDLHKRNCRLLARAAIEAMRDPTDAMVDAPLPSSPSHGGRYENRRDLRPYIYRAMIDAALNEQVSG